MSFALLFPTNTVPITVSPIGLEYAYFTMTMLLLKGFYDT